MHLIALVFFFHILKFNYHSIKPPSVLISTLSYIFFLYIFVEAKQDLDFLRQSSQSSQSQGSGGPLYGGPVHSIPQVASLTSSALARVDGIVSVSGHSGYCYAVAGRDGVVR